MAVLATFYDHIKEIAKQENIPVVAAMKEAKALGIAKLEICLLYTSGRCPEASACAFPSATLWNRCCKTAFCGAMIPMW